MDRTIPSFRIALGTEKQAFGYFFDNLESFKNYLVGLIGDATYISL